MGESYRKIKRLTLLLLFGVLLVYVLVEAREFLYPVILAILFAYLLYPVVRRLEHWGLPRILANLLTLLTSLALAVGVFVMLFRQLTVFLGDLPTLQDQALHNLDRLQFALERKFGDFHPENELWLRQQVVGAFTQSGSLIKNLLMATTATLVKFGLIPVYVFLLLYYRNKLEDFVYQQLPSSRHAKARIIIDEISLVTKRYMTGIVTVVLILCVIYPSGLLIIGLEYALLLGILSALMNFIPYFGTLIGGAIPLLYVLIVQGSPQKALAVAGFFLLVQFTENNILTPNITGSKVNINPMFTILIIIVGGMIWGVPGMFVSVPLLGMFKVYCDHTESLSSWSYLLGTDGTEEHALTLTKITRLFRSQDSSQG